MALLTFLLLEGVRSITENTDQLENLSLKGASSAMHHITRRKQEMKTLTDPVCGMTVLDSGLRVEGHDNLRFCSAGCRTTFLAAQRQPTAASSSHECCGGGHGCHHPTDQTASTS